MVKVGDRPEADDKVIRGPRLGRVRNPDFFARSATVTRLLRMSISCTAALAKLYVSRDMRRYGDNVTRIHLAASYFCQHRRKQQASPLIDEADFAIFRIRQQSRQFGRGVHSAKPDPRITTFVPPGRRRWSAFTSDLRQSSHAPQAAAAPAPAIAALRMRRPMLIV